MFESDPPTDNMIERLEGILEERKLTGRRKNFDPGNRHSLPEEDRRSGRDRRSSRRNAEYKSTES